MEKFDYFFESILENLPPSENMVFFGSFSKMMWNRTDYVQFIEKLIEFFPNKNLFFPAYTYCSRRGISYNKDLKPDPQNGALSRVVFETLFNDVNLNRSQDEDFSYLIYKQSEFENESIFTRREKSFGLNSHHEDVFFLRPIFIKLAIGLEDGFTPAMHTEALAGVPYREYISLNPSRPKLYYSRIENNDNWSRYKMNRARILDILVRNKDYVTEFNSEFEGVAIHSENFLIKSLECLNQNPEFYCEQII